MAPPPPNGIRVKENSDTKLDKNKTQLIKKKLRGHAPIALWNLNWFVM